MGAMRTNLKRLGAVFLFFLVALAFAPYVVPPFLDRIYYEGPKSAHFDGARFFNPDGDEDTHVPTRGRGGRAGFIARYLLGRDERPPWPAAVQVTPGKPPARVDGERMLVTWVGHASVLIQTQGLNILTDPIWSDKAGPFNLVGPTRVAAPGIRFDDLPRIDLVVVSHNHYDHMDLPTLKRLWDRDRPKIITSLGNDAVIGKAGVKAIALDWDKRLALKPGVDVIVSRNHHWGSRWFRDRNRALWSSFTISLPGGNLFFAGDTGFGDGQWPVEATRHGPVRFAMIPVGAFRFEAGQMESGSHIGPREALRVWNRLGRPQALPIHWGTFRLSWEQYLTPVRMLAAFQHCAGADPARFAPRRIGQSFDVGPVAGSSPIDEKRVADCSATPNVTQLL